MTGDLAVSADLHIALDFNECADPAAISDLAAIQIYQIGLVNHDTRSQLHVVRDHAFPLRLFMIRKQEKHFSGQSKSHGMRRANNNLLQAPP